MSKFVSWRRVSTAAQGMSGLGLEAQQDIIHYFVEREKGVLIADYREVYTGKELSGCTELRKAMAHCKREGATLIIAKSDRFRNTIEALQIYDEMGEGNILFCDLPRSDKFTLTLFFALAEREALLVSIRTKAALKAKKERGEARCGDNECWGKHTGANRAEVTKKASEAAAALKKEAAKNNLANKDFRDFIQDWEAIHGKLGWQADWKSISEKLNQRGKKTATGLEFTPKRAKSMYDKIVKLYEL
ncbi:MAG: recombinase family protein [Bacteroidales bacterium]|nr:recombinase family protein [Candidatus Cryptobacteroides caccocaballi]